MDIDEFRDSMEKLARTGSGYDVVIESEDEVLMETSLIGIDSLSVACTALVSLLTGYSMFEDFPPTGQVVLRISPIEDGS